MTDIHDENDRSSHSDLPQDDPSQAVEAMERDGTPSDPQRNARLPEVEQAEVTHYAYDPQTYEILCRPGQRLNPKKAARLQELNLYAHVVKFAE